VLPLASSSVAPDYGDELWAPPAQRSARRAVAATGAHFRNRPLEKFEKSGTDVYGESHTRMPLRPKKDQRPPRTQPFSTRSRRELTEDLLRPTSGGYMQTPRFEPDTLMSNAETEFSRCDTG
jgi:hypothetical protein